MPVRSVVEDHAIMDRRWALLKWLHQNASERYVKLDTILRQQAPRANWLDLFNELALLCHNRQVSFKNNDSYRYKFAAFEARPLFPHLMSPEMSADDFIALVTYPATCQHDMSQMKHQVDDWNMTFEEDTSLCRHNHPFITEMTSNGARYLNL